MTTILRQSDQSSNLCSRVKTCHSPTHTALLTTPIGIDVESTVAEFCVVVSLGVICAGSLVAGIGISVVALESSTECEQSLVRGNWEAQTCSDHTEQHDLLTTSRYCTPNSAMQLTSLNNECNKKTRRPERRRETPGKLFLKLTQPSV